MSVPGLAKRYVVHEDEVLSADLSGLGPIEEQQSNFLK